MEGTGGRASAQVDNDASSPSLEPGIAVRAWHDWSAQKRFLELAGSPPHETPPPHTTDEEWNRLLEERKRLAEERMKQHDKETEE